MVNPPKLNRIKTISKDYKRQHLPEDEASSNIISSKLNTAPRLILQRLHALRPPNTTIVMISMRDTIATSNQPRYDSFMDQHRDGNTMTSYDLNNGTIHVWIVRSKTLEVLAEGVFADSGLAKQFMVEMNTAMEKIQKSRSNVTEGGVHGTPEPEEQIVV
jgi:hypothetical protein